MKVKVVEDMLVALYVAQVDDVTCVAVECHGFDHYKRLPQAIATPDGILCGKTGWNSDKDQAYYQSNAQLVKVS